MHCVKGRDLREQDGFGRDSGNRREVQSDVRVSCKNVSRLYRSLLTQPISQPTRECLVQKKVDLRTQFGSIHSL